MKRGSETLCVCVCSYLLHVLLQLLLKVAVSYFFVSVGSEKHSFVEVSHRQHVLLVLPVYGFTEEKAHSFQQFKLPIRHRDRAGMCPSKSLDSCFLLVIIEVMRIHQFCQELPVASKDLGKKK